MRVSQVRPHFVEFIPERLEEGGFYISERFRTCSHKCFCGCGEEVVTPLSSAEWQLSREGNLVSLWPSVGNWNYACRSHYVIRRNQVLWAGAMTVKQIARARQRDLADIAQLVAATNACKDGSLQARDLAPPHTPKADTATAGSGGRLSLLRRLGHWLLNGQTSDNR